MYDLCLIKDLIELISKNLKFSEIETIGRYFFRDYSSHKINNIPETHTISSLYSAKTLVNFCVEKNKLEELVKFIIELNGNLLNGNVIVLNGLENFLYSLLRTGYYYDFKKKKLIAVTGDENLSNWGILVNGREYEIIIASIDICKSTELVKKYRQSVIEKIYLSFFDFITKKINSYNGRIWSWAGDGGIIAFRKENGINKTIYCLMEILFTLPVFNLSIPIDEYISIRIASHMGKIKFNTETEKIVSDVINLACHIEKKVSSPNSIIITKDIFSKLDDKTKRIFIEHKSFENIITYKFNHENVKLDFALSNF